LWNDVPSRQSTEPRELVGGAPPASLWPWHAFCLHIIAYEAHNGVRLGASRWHVAVCGLARREAEQPNLHGKDAREATFPARRECGP